MSGITNKKRKKRMKLSDEQENVIREIIKFPKKIQIVSGPAGSGKTTLISHLINRLENFKVCTFMGRAADVLRRKGVPAQTIHSLIYTPVLGSDGKIVRDKYGNPIFDIADKLDCNGIIVDEGSVLSKSLYKDLVSFNIPLIIFGDNNQLEPIGEDIDVMSRPDYSLTTIHRYAGELAHFANWIRQGYLPVAFAQNYPCKQVRFLNKWEADRYLVHMDQIICTFNKTRVKVNAQVRYGLGFPTGTPVINDRIMCLRNNRQIGLFNGMEGRIGFLHHKENRMQFQTEDTLFDILYDPHQFGKEKYDLDDYNRDDPSPFDWCYTRTVHRSQGGEWDKVMVFEQRCKHFDHRRLAYTAATRARESLIWVV